MPRILLPTPLRPYVDGAATVEVEGSTVGTALGALVERHPALRKHLYDDAGKVRSFVNLYKNDEDVRYLEKDETRLSADDMLSIVPSIAGGADLSNEEIRRYSRHLIMPEVGVDGQKKLKAARVLAIGAGGLGSPLAVYLAAAGIGTIGLVDFDVVDDSNLQRQILYGASDVGRPKLQAAAERLRDINPNVTIVPHETRLTSETALQIFPDLHVAGARPLLRGGRRARHPAGAPRRDPGDRDDQARARQRRLPGGPPPPRRRARDAVPRAQAPQESGLRRLRAEPDGDEAHRLRGVLRHPAGGDDGGGNGGRNPGDLGPGPQVAARPRRRLRSRRRPRAARVRDLLAPRLREDPSRHAPPEPEQALDRGRDRRPLQDGGPQREGRPPPAGGRFQEGAQLGRRHRPLGRRGRARDAAVLSLLVIPSSRVFLVIPRSEATRNLWLSRRRPDPSLRSG